MQQGVSSTRQMTFTKEKNETSPRWARDGRVFFFLSNRDAPDERRVTQPDLPDAARRRRGAAHHRRARTACRDFALSQDGKWLVYRSGKDGEEQLYRLPVAAASRPRDAPSSSRSSRPASAPGAGRRTASASTSSRPTAIDEDEKARREKKFTVNIRNAETPIVEPLGARPRPRSDDAADATDATYAVDELHDLATTASGSAFRGQSPNRYQRNITQRTSTPTSTCSRSRPGRSSG